MVAQDYVVLVAYFVLMAGIGLWSMLKIHKQEDFFLGSRSFGKLLQAFAAFGAGTGSYDPVAVGRTTFTSGISGVWSVLLWLFVTPFYWITGVWYRRMRHLTLGDWFVERYQSRAMGLAYAVFGILFMTWYDALGFSAVSKVWAPLIGTETFDLSFLSAVGFDPGMVPIRYVLVPLIALVVTVYGVLGGLRAAYWTDLIQGIFIIILSILLIPAGLSALVERFGDPNSMGILDGFRIMHQQVPADYFKIVEPPKGGEFPLHYIVAIVILNLVGVVVQPHFIATGGGSAKTETAARVGLVMGNFLKRFCTIGWALTALIVLAYMADSVELAADPDKVWSVAARELLGPFKLGLVGLMLACLLAALMSSVDCGMLMISALVVRNGYAAYIDSEASERTYVFLGRVVGILAIALAAAIALWWYDVWEQLKVAWELPILFAAPFWVGMYWRKATPLAAWATVLFTLSVFVVLPLLLPVFVPSLAENPRYTQTNELVTTVVSRPAAPADVARRQAAMAAWDRQVEEWLAEDPSRTEAGAIARFGREPEPLAAGEVFEDKYHVGGRAIYWTEGVEPVGKEDFSKRDFREVSREEKDHELVIRQRYDVPTRGTGSFQVDFLLYDWLGVPLEELSDNALETLRLPTMVVLPFVVMIVVSLVTPAAEKGALDRYYVKMKTPVDPDPETDLAELDASYANPSRFDDRRLFPYLGLEVQRPKLLDVAGFVVSFLICFAIIWVTVWLVNFQ